MARTKSTGGKAKSASLVGRYGAKNRVINTEPPTTRRRKPKRLTIKRKSPVRDANGKVVKKGKRGKKTFFLRDCSRVEQQDSLFDLNDAEFTSKCKLEPIKQCRFTRQTNHPYRTIADNLPVLEAGHSLDEEAWQFNQFLEELNKTITPRKIRNSIFYATKHALWCTTTARFASLDMKLSTAHANPNSYGFWYDYNGCPSRIALDVNEAIRTCRKPVVVLAGQQSFNRQVGHCVAVIVVPRETGKFAYVKESKSLNESKIMENVYKLLGKKNGMSIREFSLIGAMNFEEDVTYTECMKEAYKVVGDMLDGNFVYDLPKAKDYTIKYNTYSRYRI